jgi:hypothetical protein
VDGMDWGPLAPDHIVSLICGNATLRNRVRRPLGVHSAYRASALPLQRAFPRLAADSLDSHPVGARTLTLSGRIGLVTMESAWKKSASDSSSHHGYHGNQRTLSTISTCSHSRKHRTCFPLGELVLRTRRTSGARPL